MSLGKGTLDTRKTNTNNSTGGVIKELEFLGRVLQEAFGVIGESATLFEALFENHGAYDGEAGRPELEDR